MPTRNAATTVNAGDTEYFRAIADKYRELTGLRSAGVSRTPAGAFFEYGYYQFGVPVVLHAGLGAARRRAGARRRAVAAAAGAPDRAPPAGMPAGGAAAFGQRGGAGGGAGRPGA